MKGLCAVALVGVMLLTGASLARAQSDDNEVGEDGNAYTLHGAYAGLGASWLVSGFQGEFKPQDFGNSWGFNGRGGYRFFPWFAAEALLEYGNEYDARAAGSSGQARTLSTTVAAKFILPLDRFQPYLTLGGGFLRAETENNGGFVRNIGSNDIGFAGRIGAGVDFYLTPHWSVFVDNGWTMATKDTADLYYYALGFGGRYNF